MDGAIKKIDLIKNMAVFQGFRWASSVRDGGGNIAEFKEINIFVMKGSTSIRFAVLGKGDAKREDKD